MCYTARVPVFGAVFPGLLDLESLARLSREPPAATADMAVLQGVLACLILRGTVHLRLGSDTLRVPSGTRIFTVWRQQFRANRSCNYKVTSG